MARRLKLTRSQLVEVNYQYLGAFRLRVEVSDPSGSGADPYVFLYNRRPLDPYTNTADDDFMAIASPGDMAEYPVGQPRAGTTYPFFRTNVVELDFRATEQAEETWALIVLEVGNLCKILDRMDQLVPTAELWVGAPLDGGPSESLSTSNSVSGSASGSTSV